ncbi:4-hydroxybutyrate CoA-transferase [Porphyromonas gingivalis]|uniref:acetyl-CoA hydrolase/transferase family protein n=1 Tax=Porphyromonas gingivalis TaxID=837 RepID=UPI000B4DE3C9|nr:acetyl-CoA hydrolase/transferase C-terminal domain-containing protein [Porphyromonas gingivalis]MCE8165086.1 acetyl-CoA hydrolase/transferase family protein [Porphyromonas gingivalis]MCE8179727.1 acetyl-CoA hydrolase/transferase family protein [Porphyromonas gingivalis]OWP34598.1 4-hydroxybutyrate CoA-transferase [Porphyromonas gingivalis]
MKDVLAEYASRIVSAEEAVKHIKNGERVALSHAAGVPQSCVDALVQQADLFQNVEIYHMLCLGEGKYMAPEMAPHFRHITNFVGGNSRKAVEENRADFIPVFFYEVPSMIRKDILHIDVAIVQLSMPDENGYCSFGVSCDYSKPAAESAHLVIGEINRQMPYVHGDNLIHISKLDYIVMADYPIYSLAKPKIGEVEEAIGRNCAELIEDGATLQLGIGAIPDAALLFLKDKKDLGIHTEMFSDGVVELVRSGVITGKKKTLHPGKMVATFLMGSEDVYHFIDKNPDVELYPVDYVNDPRVIAQNDNMVSINSCIEVDLMGQVVSECIGSKQFSGTGGQVDYVRGAAWSKNGKSIMAIPSTAKNGTASRIVPIIAEGAAVTTLRNEVDYVVTEYGIAQLKGKSLRQRAEALIAIAHPDFREELTEHLRKRFG